MKNILTFLLLFLFVSKSFSQQDKSHSIQYNFLLNASKEATVIFEGKVIKENKSFLGTEDNNIFTSYTVQVDEVLLGNIKKGTIEVIVLGGQIEKDGMTHISQSDHGNGLCLGQATFFCKPSTNGASGIINSNPGDYRLIGCFAYNGLGVLQLGPYDSTYTTKKELYNDLIKLKAVKIPREKKSPAVNEKEKKSNNSSNNPDYQNNIKRYQENLALLLKKIERAKLRKNPAPFASEVTFSLANPVVTGTSPRYFEFDIMVSTNGNTIYYDGALFRLSYNTAAFGSEVIKNNKISITKGSAFNSSTYTDPTLDKIDQTTSMIGIPFNSDFNQTSWSRTLITSKPVQLLHFKIEIQSCGQNVGIDFADQSTTEMFSSYTTNSGDAISDAKFFETTNYQNSLNNIPCQVLINNFNSPVNGGVGDILEIQGSGFGDTRGTGQVKFKNADDGGKTYIQQLDAEDYISWSEKLIKIKVPSIKIPSGSGDFIVKNDLGDSAISNQVGKSFQVYYSLLNAVVDGKKYHTYLHNRNNNGGYTIRLDTSVANHPERVQCIKKAIKDWKCAATVNFIIGKDTVLSKTDDDNISVIYFGDIGEPTVIGTTRRYTYSCSNPLTITAIKDFDIVIQQSHNWSYDTTGAIIPTGYNSFLEVITHELGHAFGLRHIIDDSRIMYYAAQNSGKVPRTLQPNTSDADGALAQVGRSITAINAQCNWKDMIPSNSNCSITTEAEELLMKKDVLKIFPNPTAEKELNIVFQSSVGRITKIIVYDLFGKEVYNQLYPTVATNDNLYRINIAGLAPGLYSVNVITESNSASAKFIKY